MLFAYGRDNATPYYNLLGILKFENVYKFKVALFTHKILNGSTTSQWYSIEPLGPLHMSSVNRGGSVSEISVFATEISVTGMKIFPYEHSSPVTGTKRFFKQISFAVTT